MNTIDERAVTKREDFFIALYKKAFPPVAKYISHRGGLMDEAKDVFQDALVILYEKYVADGLIEDSNQVNYLVGIAKHLWSKRYRGMMQYTELDELDLADDNAISPESNRLLNILEKAGSKCLQLLKSFYYDQRPLQEIAETFGFSGIRSATVQKYKCLEKVRETVKQKALTYEDFVA